MRLTREQSYALLAEHGCYVNEACDKCGQLLGHVRFSRHGSSGVWCSRECRDGAAAYTPGTCKGCGATLPQEKRRGALFCDAACKQNAHRSKPRELSVTK